MIRLEGPCMQLWSRRTVTDPCLCLRATQHGLKFSVVRRYEVAKKKGDYDEEALKREHAKNALERYMHYYQRWAENDRARVSALKAAADVVSKKLEGLSELTATPTSQLKFLPDAWAQVCVHCACMHFIACVRFVNFPGRRALCISHSCPGESLAGCNCFSLPEGAGCRLKFFMSMSTAFTLNSVMACDQTWHFTSPLLTCSVSRHFQ